MKTSTRIHSELTTRTRRANGNVRVHKLPICETSGLARYRDRHQARQAAEAMCSGRHDFEVSTFACPECRGHHVEQIARRRRYLLVDVENVTHGAKATCTQVAALWNTFRQQAPGISPSDRVVIGAARPVVHKYRAAIDGDNVTWVVGADGPDGADRALLAAIDLRRTARDFDELVIVSGDHAFVELAGRAKALGLSVHVITTQNPDGTSPLSRKLAAVASTHTTVRLESLPQRPELAVAA